MPSLVLPSDVNEEAARLAAAIGLFQDGLVPLRKAAELAGVNYRAFLDALQERGIPAFTYTEQMLEDDLRFVREGRVRED